MPFLDSHLGELAAVGTAVCWTATALAFAAAGQRIGSLNVNLIRLALAVLLLAAANAALRGQVLPLDASGETWAWLILSGLVGFVFGDLCLFRAFVEIGPRLSALVMCLAPPFAALLGWLALGERLGLDDLGAMALVVGGIGWAVWERSGRRHQPPGPAAAGPGATDPATEVAVPAVPGDQVPLSVAADAAADIALVAAGSSADAGPGDAPPPPRSDGHPTVRGLLLAVGGALGQAGGLVLSKRGMGTYHPLAATQIRVFAGFFGFLLVFALLHRWRRLRTALADRRGLGYTAVGAFFGPFLGVSLSLLAVQRTPAGIAASIMSISPVLLVPVSILRGESVGTGGWFGALLAVGGVALLFLF